MDAAGLRPLGIGEVLDTSIKVYRARFGSLVKATAAVVGPVYVLFGLIQLSVLPDPEGSTTLETSTTAGDIGAAASGVVVTILLVFATQFATAVAVQIVSGAYIGEDVPWRESVRAAWGKAGSMMWLTVLFGLAVIAFTLVAIVGVLPGIPALAVVWVSALIVAAVYCMVGWMVAIPALMAEGVRGRKALGRSLRLVRKRWWPTLVSVMLAGILVQILMMVFTLVVLGVLGAAGSWTVEVVAGVFTNTVGAAVATPFIAAVVVVIYFDLRVRKEGFDLELLARQIGATPVGMPPSAPPAPLVDDPSRPPYWPPPPGWRPPDA